MRRYGKGHWSENNRRWALPYFITAAIPSIGRRLLKVAFLLKWRHDVRDEAGVAMTTTSRRTADSSFHRQCIRHRLPFRASAYGSFQRATRAERACCRPNADAYEVRPTRHIASLTVKCWADVENLEWNALSWNYRHRHRWAMLRQWPLMPRRLMMRSSASKHLPCRFYRSRAAKYSLCLRERLAKLAGRLVVSS